MSDDLRPGPVDHRPDPGVVPTRSLGPALALAGILALGFLFVTVLVADSSTVRDFDQLLNRNYHVQGLWWLLHGVDRIGQRAVCLPLLGLVVAVISWRHRTFRPVLLAAVSVFGINLIVLICKLWLARGAPLEGDPNFFVGNGMYPSGHTANIIVVYGLCAYLITHYGRANMRWRRLLRVAVGVLSVVMFITSLVLRWHWFTDLVAGYLIGGAVFVATVAIDAAVPFRSHRLIVAPSADLIAPEPVAPPPRSDGVAAQSSGAAASRRTVVDLSTPGEDRQ
ncbi:MAG: phosphatase PAP2 family protein [Nocardioidaceae bacterium]